MVFCSSDRITETRTRLRRCRPAGPKTLMSGSEWVPSRFEPCTETQATSPAAYSPARHLGVVRSTSASTFVGTPPPSGVSAAGG